MKKGAPKQKAKDRLAEVEKLVNPGAYLPAPEIPKFSEVAEQWLTQKQLNVRSSTLEMYRGHIKYHFDDIKDIPVNRITIATVEKFIADKQTADMNLNTLKKVIISFGQVMNYAVRHRYAEFNAVREAERPRNRGQVEKPKIRVLTPAEINAFLNAVEDQKYRVLFRLAIFSGARQGELIGLKWTDVDWLNSQIAIKRTYNNGAWFKPKSKTSARTIDLGPSMIGELRAWHKVCPKTELDLVFPSDSGGPINHSVVYRKHFWPALKKAGIGQLRFHDLRHLYASMLLDAGEPIKYVQTSLGHASAQLTLDTYGHLMRPVNQAAARRLENSVFSGDGDQMVTKKEKGITAIAVTP